MSVDEIKLNRWLGHTLRTNDDSRVKLLVPLRRTARELPIPTKWYISRLTIEAVWGVCEALFDVSGAVIWSLFLLRRHGTSRALTDNSTQTRTCYWRHWLETKRPDRYKISKSRQVFGKRNCNVTGLHRCRCFCCCFTSRSLLIDQVRCRAVTSWINRHHTAYRRASRNLINVSASSILFVIMWKLSPVNTAVSRRTRKRRYR